MRHGDTIDKVISIYLAGLCREEFTYKGKLYRPKPVHVSPDIFRGYSCFEGCGACCGSFSLDYLPHERIIPTAITRSISIDDRQIIVTSDRQTDVSDRWCRFLDRDRGRCTIYERRPFACDFELIRFLIYEDKVWLTQKLYGRFWAMRRLDANTGAKCEILQADAKSVQEVIRKLHRLSEWAQHFGIRTCLPDIFEWAESDRRTDRLSLAI
jgi:Fe-S-cluster containining protein